MAKRGGLGSGLWIAGYDLSNDAMSYNVNGGPGKLVVTGIDKSAQELIGGVRSGKAEFSSAFNDAAGRSHIVLSALPTTDVALILATALTLGADGAMLIAKQIDYPLTRPADGSLTSQISAEANGYGVQWGKMLTAGLRTESAATNGASVDFVAASTDFGLSAVLIVTALASGTPTILLQDSANDSTFANITGATFGTVAALDNEIVQTTATQNIRRYIRVVTSGTFSGLSFVVVGIRHSVATI